MVARLRYTVTIEPDAAHVDLLEARRVRTTIDAPDKDEALDRAEGAYRRMYPRAGKLTLTIVRLRPRP